jgi:hypothetical protein
MPLGESHATLARPDPSATSALGSLNTHEFVLTSSRRFVSRADGEAVARQIGARAYKECSALRIEGVDDVFEAATRASMLMPGPSRTARMSTSDSEGPKCCIIC